MSELLSCPFCGGESNGQSTVNVTETARSGPRFGVHCYFCGARVEFFETMDEAVAAWNTRVERTCHETEIDKFFRGCDSCGWMWEVFYSFGKRERPRYCPNCGAKVVEE